MKRKCLIATLAVATLVATASAVTTGSLTLISERAENGLQHNVWQWQTNHAGVFSMTLGQKYGEVERVSVATTGPLTLVLSDETYRFMDVAAIGTVFPNHPVFGPLSLDINTTSPLSGYLFLTVR